MGRTSNTNTGSVPQIMNTPPSPASTARSSREPRDTGFPEPFGDNYNTTLPHPDADLSPNATISSDNLTPAQSMTRRRLSLLSKHRRTISQGSTLSSPLVHSVLPLITTGIPGQSGSDRASETDNHRESMEPRRDGDNSPSSSPAEDDEGGDKRKSLFGRLRRKSRV
ncbi:uncharacterized protein J7T54_003489 [Emericellopsis cladophorae]|uniref:Uncharacterized protein n=1 Tax=Emericellopsis cladophorae TaxID=2686198 RepID=A0A9P9Y2V2_9HYPO|nr:uncharacterized protein J7T54_003489 [Emericellopsis cladophorae]KAI6782070.1 hypothetical protein J7T54_003489 [Emericellopsis cladophorae]